MAEPLDLETLKRRGVVMGNTPSVHYTEDEHRAVVAALERIPELARDLADVRQAFDMAKATIERRAKREAEKDRRLERAERVESAAREACREISVNEPHAALVRLTAALAPASGEDRAEQREDAGTFDRLASQKAQAMLQTHIRAERDELRVALAAAREEAKRLGQVADAWCSDRDVAREENGRLKEELLKRGRHLPGCAWLSCIEAGQKGHDAMARMVRYGCPACDCGWETMRAALVREDGDV